MARIFDEIMERIQKLSDEQRNLYRQASTRVDSGTARAA